MPGSLIKTFAIGAAIACALATAAQASITISTHKTKDESCSAGICTPTGPNPNIRVKDLQKLLAHSDVKIVTGQGSTGIGVFDPLTWASKHRLTLDANQSIHIRAPMVVEGTGGVTLITNDGGTGGDYDFDATTSGSLTFWDTTSSLIINGANFTLVKDIKTLAADAATNSAGNYALASNYDAAVDGTYSASPLNIGFSGTLEGLGNVIQNLTVVGDQPNQTIGLVSGLNPTGTIRDLNLTNASMSGTENVGALVGFNLGTIAETSVAGSVFIGPGEGWAGGLTGSSYGQIVRSSFNGKVVAPGGGGARHGSVIGGITGYLTGTVLQSAATVDASGGFMAGGLVGEFSRGTITLSRAYGTVSGFIAGGLVGGAGFNSSVVILQSFAGANVVPKRQGGGLIGSAYNTQITQSYSTGAIQSTDKRSEIVGGLAGVEANVSVSQAYAAGSVNSSSSDLAGGFGGECFDGTFSAAYWDITTTNQNADHCGATGLTDAQLKSALPVGFDPNVWGQSASINNGWPYLLANPPQ